VSGGEGEEEKRKQEEIFNSCVDTAEAQKCSLKL
jgi:hypothetical protein